MLHLCRNHSDGHALLWSRHCHCHGDGASHDGLLLNGHCYYRRCGYDGFEELVDMFVDLYKCVHMVVYSLVWLRCVGIACDMVQDDWERFGMVQGD